MADRATPDQIGRIDELGTQLGLDFMGLFNRVRQIIGRPVPMSTSTLTADEAAVVICALETDTLQPTLPYDIPQDVRR